MDLKRPMRIDITLSSYKSLILLASIDMRLVIVDTP